MKKFIAVVLVCICVFGVIGCNQQPQQVEGNVGCVDNNYNAELYDTAGEWINEDFAKNNLVRTLGDPENDYPKSLVFIVDNQEDYNQIFNENAAPINVDFDKQMLVVYTFSTEYHRSNTIESIIVENDVLKITYQMEKKQGVGDASMPYQRWFVVKLEKLDVNSAVFEEVE